MRRGRATESGSRHTIGPTRSRCSRSRARIGSRSSSRCVTAGCSRRRSPSSAAPRCIMAADLAPTPRSGITVQLCGDAHLSNFGVFASPERKMLFDINDFDETLPGPWEWDVKRLAASFEVCGRELGFGPADRRDDRHRGGRAISHGHAARREMRTLDVWYDHIDVDEILAGIDDAVRQRLGKAEARRRWMTRQGTDARPPAGLLEASRHRGRRVAVRGRPTADRAGSTICCSGLRPRRARAWIGSWSARTGTRSRGSTIRSRSTASSTPPGRWSGSEASARMPGSSSWSAATRATRCSCSRRRRNRRSWSASWREQRYANCGQRVVVGQRLMQAASDIFLGWWRVTGLDGQQRDYYTGSCTTGRAASILETFRIQGATVYAELCGATLARAHARWGDRIAIATYLGKGDAFDRAIARFAAATPIRTSATTRRSPMQPDRPDSSRDESLANETFMRPAQARARGDTPRRRPVPPWRRGGRCGRARR